MRSAILKRIHDDGKQTYGTFTSGEFNCDSLELAWKNNKSNISCIPAGQYTATWTQSNRLTKLTGHPYFTYEILNVPNRAGIRLHSSSYCHDLLGCVTIGNYGIDLDKDGELDISSSRVTLNNFVTLMNKEDFTLFISSVT